MNLLFLYGAEINPERGGVQRVTSVLLLAKCGGYVGHDTGTRQCCVEKFPAKSAGWAFARRNPTARARCVWTKSLRTRFLKPWRKR